jgi:hypothetical protein
MGEGEMAGQQPGATASGPVEGQTLLEHLFLWLVRNAAGFLDNLRGTRTAGEVLTEYARTGDRSSVLGGAYIARTGRPLHYDMLALLQRWIDDLIAGPDEVRVYGSDLSTGPQLVDALQLRSILPAAHLDERDLMRALADLLRAIYAAELSFGGRRYRVGVFRRTPVVQQPGETDAGSATEVSTLVAVADPGAVVGPVPALQFASDDQIDQAIKGVYDAFEEAGRKPPNINEIPQPVQERLAKRSLRARSARRIKVRADTEKFKARRRPSGRYLPKS